MSNSHKLRRLVLFILLVAFVSGFNSPVDSRKKEKNLASRAQPVIWRDPGNVARLDLRYGPGSPELAPKPPFKFFKEVKEGGMPKFDIKDARGVEWRVKLGEEAQSETVATRLVWAAGYFAEEAYYFPHVKIEGLPRLSRGRKFVERQSFVRGARFEPRRDDIVRGPEWGWNKNPFMNTPQLDGLKVLMILLNNWDAQKKNNRILYAQNGRSVEARYVVTDLGATLGKADGLGGRRTKNNLRDFLSTEFVRGVKSSGDVKFDYDTRPTRLGMLTVFYPPFYFGRTKIEKTMRHIPVDHAQWIGRLLSQLTDEQLRDAFRAAGYGRGTMNAYVGSLRRRINQLNQLNAR